MILVTGGTGLVEAIVISLSQRNTINTIYRTVDLLKHGDFLIHYRKGDAALVISTGFKPIFWIFPVEIAMEGTTRYITVQPRWAICLLKKYLRGLMSWNSILL
jgi:hypothetical protein